MEMKKSAFIPAKFGKENATGILSHTLELNLGLENQAKKFSYC